MLILGFKRLINSLAYCAYLNLPFLTKRVNHLNETYWKLSSNFLWYWLV